MIAILRSLALGVPLAAALAAPLSASAEPIRELEIRHEAGPGDSLSRVALLYGVELDALLERNGIEATDFLALGGPVVVPLAGASAEAVAETAARGRVPGPTLTLAAAAPLEPAEAPEAEQPIEAPGAAETSAPEAGPVAEPPAAGTLPREASAEPVEETPEAAAEAPAGPPPLTVPRQARRLLERAEQELRAARYTEARLLARLGLAAGPERPSVRAGLERVAGTAELALGQVEQAVECFVRALEADPALAADPAETSPKVARILEIARTRRASP